MRRFIPWHSRDLSVDQLRSEIAKFDRREKDRAKLDRDPNRVEVAVHAYRMTTVIIISRDSSVKESMQEKWTTQKSNIMKALQNGKILKGLEKATYATAHWYVGLRKAMPLTMAGKHKGIIVRKIEEMGSGSQVRFVCVDLALRRTTLSLGTCVDYRPAMLPILIEGKSQATFDCQECCVLHK